MNESSEESIDQKYVTKPLVLNLRSLDSSNSSENDDIIFSSNSLLNKYDIGSKTSVTTRSNNKNLFSSEDILIQKKNLFGSTSSPIQKEDKGKPNYILTTEPGLIKVKNYHSPNKKYSVFKLIEKEKKNKREFKSKLMDLKKEKKEESPKQERRDIYGNIINKKNKKKIKVSFIDKVTHQPLANIIDIESFRNYNYTTGIPKEDKIINNIPANCQCCFIFWLILNLRYI